MRRFLLPGLALLMLATIAVPAGVWRAPENDLVTEGFDPVTMYTSTTVDAAPAAMDVGHDTLTMTTLQGSTALVHLLTTPLSYEASFSFRVSRADRGTDPLSVAVTAPYLRNELRVVLAGAPSRSIRLERVVDGMPVEQTVVGTYAVGAEYDVSVRVDRDASTATLEVVPQGGGERHAIALADDGRPFIARVIADEPVPVTAGRSYTLSADVLVAVAGSAGTAIEWLGPDGERLDVDAEWVRVEPGPWTGVEVRAVAPVGAVAARPEIGFADGGSGQVTSIRLDDGASTVLAGRFEDGTDGWRRAGTGEPLEVVVHPAEPVEVSADDSWGLFDALRMALTVTSSADDGVAQVELTEYRLEVPHQRWMAVRVSDPVLTVLVIVLGALGLAWIGAQVVRAWREGAVHRWLARVGAPRVLTPTWGMAAVLGAVVLYLVASSVLAARGSLNADVIGARVWAYSVAGGGLDALYVEPNVSSAEAGQWQGHALQEAGFPYGPTMAYLIGAIGLVYRYGIHQPALGVPDAAAIDALVRGANTVLGVVAAVLIALIVRTWTGRRTAVTVGTVFLLAPALAVSNSIWGSTQSMSLVVLLAAVLLLRRGRMTGAWVFLLLAMMTRPQNLVVAAVLALVLLRAVPWRSTVQSLGRAVVVVYVVLLPFSLSLSPTLPVDVVWNALFMHVGDGNDDWTLPLSWGAFGPWQLVAGVAEGVGGVDATLFPATAELGLGRTFYEWGTLGFLAAMGSLGAVVLIRGRRLLGGQHLVVATLAILALLLVKTGAPSYHMLLPTALVFLLVGVLPRWAYLYATVTLSTTTFLSMYGMGAYWLTAHPDWSVGVYDEGSWLAGVFAAAVQDPVVVTLASVANTGVLVVLAASLVRGPGGRDPERMTGDLPVSEPALRPEGTHREARRPRSAARSRALAPAGRGS